MATAFATGTPQQPNGRPNRPNRLSKSQRLHFFTVQEPLALGTEAGTAISFGSQ
jgi:hypothetical protein